ncbi:MAG: hypothetical protein ACLTSG_00785 [Lachnospiraceae bacterium]
MPNVCAIGTVAAVNVARKTEDKLFAPSSPISERGRLTPLLTLKGSRYSDAAASIDVLVTPCGPGDLEQGRIDISLEWQPSEHEPIANSHFPVRQLLRR